jgi:hypothetical protein
MSSAHVEELLALGDHLTEVTGSGSAAHLIPGRIRRSISTSYYALFHFLLHEATTRLVGRVMPCKPEGMCSSAFSPTAVSRMRCNAPPISVPVAVKTCGFFWGSPAKRRNRPEFLRSMADAFADAHRLRNEADLDMKHAICLLMLLGGKIPEHNK